MTKKDKKMREKSKYMTLIRSRPITIPDWMYGRGHNGEA